MAFFSSIITIIIITLSLLIKNSLCQNSPSPTTSSPASKTSEAVVEESHKHRFKLIFNLIYIFTFLNLISVIFVLVRIYLRWRSNKGKFSMALRVPLYLGILDSILLVLEIINVIYPTIYNQILPQPYCSMLSGTTIGGIYFSRFMVASIAITTYLRVCKKIYYNYGTYDWKLWTICGTITLVLTISGYKNYGPTEFWCAAKPSTVYTPILSLALSISIIFVCTFCYYNTVMEIRIVKENTSSIGRIPRSEKGSDQEQLDSTSRYRTATLSRNDEVEARVTKKVTGYILVFILQWVPNFPYEVLIILNRSEIWAFALVVVSFNIGAVGNAIFYVINEGWSTRGRETTLRSEALTEDGSGNSDSSTRRIGGGNNENAQESTRYTSEFTVNIDVHTITTVDNNEIHRE